MKNTILEVFLLASKFVKKGKESNNVTSRPGRQKSALLAPIIGGNPLPQSLVAHKNHLHLITPHQRKEHLVGGR